MRQVLYPQQGPRLPAEEADLTARFVPGFGGLYQDRVTETLIVNLTDTAQRTTSLAVLAELLACNAIYPGWLGTRIQLSPVLIRQGRFRSDELKQWASAMAGLASDSGVSGMEVDPLLNRLWIGVRNQAAASRVGQAAGGAQVPFEALLVEEHPLQPLLPSLRTPESVVAQEFQNIGWSIPVPITHSNAEPVTVMQGRCVIPGSAPLRHEPAYTLQKWDGLRWRTIHFPVCDPIALAQPVVLAPGSARADTINVTANYRLNSFPIWDNPRIAGYYRFIIDLYRWQGSNQPVAADSLPTEARATTVFSLRH